MNCILHLLLLLVLLCTATVLLCSEVRGDNRLKSTAISSGIADEANTRIQQRRGKYSVDLDFKFRAKRGRRWSLHEECKLLYKNVYNQKTQKKGWWLWKRKKTITTTKQKPYYKCKCKKGWKREYGSKGSCTKAICFGKIDYCPNGGSCVRPDYCANCNPTHYSPRCDFCPQITNCQRTHCTHDPSPDYTKYCANCKYDHSPRGSAYKLSDDKKSCTATCSWRAEHNLCYPGKCPGVEKTCRCDAGFTSTTTAYYSVRNCLKIINDASFMRGEMRLSVQMSGSTSNDVVIVEFDKSINNEVYVNSKVVAGNKLNMHWDISSQYQPHLSTPEDSRKYFLPSDKRAIGLTAESLEFEISGSSNLPPRKMGPISEIGISQSNPKTHLSPFRGEFSQFPPPGWQLDTAQRLKYTYSVTNGGYITVLDLDRGNAENKRYFTGRTASFSSEFVFDYTLPYHCSVGSDGVQPCSEDFDREMLTVSDAFTRENRITVKFGGWRDDHAGVESLHVELVPMYKVGSQLDENHNGETGEVVDFSLKNKTRDVKRRGGDKLFQVELPLPTDKPAVYAAIITVKDSVANSIKNFRCARRFFIFDNSSRITARHERYPLVIDRSVSNDGQWWLTDLDQKMYINWTSHFINEVHEHNGFLLAVKQHPETYDAAYDHRTGLRNIDAIDNVDGIIQFSSQIKVGSSGGDSIQLPDEGDWKISDRLHLQRENFDLQRSDGQSVRFWVRAEDIMGNSNISSILLHIDSSPPVIEDVHLMNAGVEGLLVHSRPDLHSMNVQWKVMDPHSGIHSVRWEVYDTFHGHEVLNSQNEAKRRYDSSESCQSQSERPHHCYCTAATGCYNRFFASSPNGHVNASTDHNHDLFLKVTVTNNALLTSEAVVKITIDISAPHPGHVFDGIPGDPDVDFQTDLEIQGHWNGFFDPESGVRLYKYGFGAACISDVAQLKHQTRSQQASWTANGTGTYFLTVVAFNNAMEPSAPVCSDGVTIVDEAPSLKRLRVSGLRLQPGLIKDAVSGDMWYLTAEAVMQRLLNDNATCRERALNLPDTSLFAFDSSKYNRSAIHLYRGGFCEETPAAAMQMYFTDVKAIKVRWEAEDKVAGMRTFQVSLSHSQSGDPPLFGPVESHQPEVILRGADLVDGDSVYLIVRAVNRAGLHTDRILGPVIVDTSAPISNGQPTVKILADSLVAEWLPTDFQDPESEPLTFEIGIGSRENTADILHYQPITKGAGCQHSNQSQSTCGSVPLASLDWNLIGSHTYHISIRCTNQAQLHTVTFAEPLVHSKWPPTAGRVTPEEPDANSSDGMFGEAAPLAYQLRSDTIKARWSNFLYADGFEVAVVEEDASVVKSVTVPAGTKRYQFQKLQLRLFKTYKVKVTARNSLGSASAMSSGVTIEANNQSLQLKPSNWLPIRDGSVSSNHQSSLSVIGLQWQAPYEPVRSLFHRVEWSLERMNQGDWKSVMSWRTVEATTNSSLSVTHLDLKDGGEYRQLLRLCRSSSCSSVERTPVLNVQHSAPVAGAMNVSILDDNATILLRMEPFQQLPQQAVKGIAWHEWTLMHDDVMIVNWTRLELESKAEVQNVTLQLSSALKFTKCITLAVRAVNKAGLHAMETRQLKDCNSYDPKLITDPVVFDAVAPVQLEENARWLQDDADYTAKAANLSAVWPSLRYPTYEWALIVGRGTAGGTYFDGALMNPPKYPINHPDAIAGGIVNEEFVNAPSVELLTGRRYHICIHANATELVYEKFTQALPELAACSDGVTVMEEVLHRGTVSINGDADSGFVTSLTDLHLSWQGFESQHEMDIPHVSHIMKYHFCIGSYSAGCDVIALTSVGQQKHAVVTHLRGKLQEGYIYFVTVTATTFIGTTATSFPRSFRVALHPPEVNAQPSISVGIRQVISARGDLQVCWHNKFHDKVAGIRRYWAGIGSSEHHADVLSLTETAEDCIKFSKGQLQALTEGQHYFVVVKAENFAGLIASASSGPALVDYTPPHAGSVLDLDPTVSNKSDCNYKSHSASLMASWSDFRDPHSHVSDYWVAVGSSEKVADVMPYLFVGARTNVSLHHLQLKTGERYFVSVRGCNAADLCSTASSNGVIIDFSEPVVGVVTIGASDTNQEFLSANSTLSFSLNGFNDPESDIAYHRWAVTELNSSLSDSLNWTVISADIHFVTTDQEFPTGEWLQVVIETHNKAGLSSVTESLRFQFDESPPTVTQALTNQGSPGVLVEGYSVLVDALTVQWKVEDAESGIASHWISLTCHNNGKPASDPIKIPGLREAHSFHNTSLKDGAQYDVQLISCNLAELCTEQKLTVTVDSTAPVLGHIAAQTESAIDLGRDTQDGMKWEENYFNLTWVGFEDPHSNVDFYEVEVGSSFLGSSVSQITKIAHHDEGVNGTETTAEGPIQLGSIELDTIITAGTTLIIHLTAVNQAGLRSQPVHAALTAMDTGELFLVRRCQHQQSATCYGHCVCAPHHRRCQPRLDIGCNEVPPIDSVDSLIEVLDVVSHDRADIDETVTFTRSMLAGSWRISKQSGRSPARYEFSVGLAEYDEPKGIFDLVRERVWFDAGRRTFAVMNITSGRSLSPFRRYKFFVRAWYDENTYSVFFSNGVFVNPNAPQVNTQMGVGVKELLSPESRTDTDFITDRTEVTVAWRRKFRSASESLIFRVSLGSASGMNDIAEVSVRNQSLHTFKQLDLSPNRRYFSTVTAADDAGLMTSVISDGFSVDEDEPEIGHVYSGPNFVNSRFTKNQHEIGASWHGFFDLTSFIKSYSVCVGSSEEDNRCDVAGWVSTSFQQSAKLNGSWSHGSTLLLRVVAKDAAKRKSAIVSSEPITVDTTPPHGLHRGDFSRNILANPSFEENAEEVKQTLSHSDLTSLNCTPNAWRVTEGRAAAVRVGRANASDGSAVLFLFGRISQTVATVPNQKYLVTFAAAHLPVVDPLSVTIDGMLTAPNLHDVFHLFCGAESHSGEGNSRMQWHKQAAFFTAGQQLMSEVAIESLTPHSGLAIDDVSVRHVQLHTSSDKNGPSVHLFRTTIEEWSSIQASWDIDDPDSGISAFYWAVGTVPGGTQLLGFTFVGAASQARATPSSRLVHNTSIHASVLAINGAGIAKLFHSAPLLLDLTPPSITFVHDGDSPTGHTDLQPSAEVLKVQFHAADHESGLGTCEWCSGLQPHACDVADYVALPHATFSASRRIGDHQKLIGTTVYSTLRCNNSIGLWSARASPGVKIYSSAPDASSATVDVHTSVTPVSPQRVIDNATDFQISWRGFQDGVGIRNYQIRILDLINQSLIIHNWLNTSNGLVNVLDFSNAQLRDGGEYLVEVRAVNALGRVSDAVAREILVDAGLPVLTNQPLRVSYDANLRHLTINWADMFLANSEIIFEATVETELGHADLLKWYSTKMSQLQLKAIDPDEQRLFLRLTATNAAGLASWFYKEIEVTE